MNDHDQFEDRLATLLREQVDHDLGARRPAPPFDAAAGPSRVTGHRAGRLTPLLAAACVLVVVAATFGIVALVTGSRDRHEQGPGRPTPSGNRTSLSPTPSSSSSSPSEPATHTVAVGGATLTVPTGWVARDYRRYLGSGVTTANPTWCLTPGTRRASTAPHACPIEFSRVGRVNGQYDVDIDADGGVVGDPPQYCENVDWHTDYAQRTFGARSAEWRRFTITCPNGTIHRHEQYVVDTLPGYILHTDDDTDAVARVMTLVARTSVLPAQTAPLALMQNGIVRSVQRTAAGVRLAVQPTLQVRLRGGNAWVDTPYGTSRAVDYLVPTRLYDAAGAPGVGTRVYLTTDGRVVTACETRT